MQLTARKREILRRVIEEYVATGQPVGSRVLVERSGLAVSPSTVAGELAELEALGLLTHPHTSAGRTPTESGYRIYAEELVDGLEGRPDGLGVDLRTMRDEIEQALRTTTDMLSRRDAAARARLGAVARDRVDSAHRGAAASADERHGRRDHLDRRRDQARVPAG